MSTILSLTKIINGKTVNVILPKPEPKTTKKTIKAEYIAPAICLVFISANLFLLSSALPILL